MQHKEKLYHANLLKRYREREPAVVATIVSEEVEPSAGAADAVPSCPLTTTETVSDVKFEGTLTKDQQTTAESLLARFTDVMTEHQGEPPS